MERGPCRGRAKPGPREWAFGGAGEGGARGSAGPTAGLRTEGKRASGDRSPWPEARAGPGPPPAHRPDRLTKASLHVPQTGEEHTVTHLQYVAWPDHGVPDDSSDFLEFVNYVKSLRVDAEPVLVHCRYRGMWVFCFWGFF